VADHAPRRPTVIAFDVVETLFSLEPLRDRLKEAGLPDAALGEWFARFLRDAFALDAAGVYKPFREVASGALAVMLAEHSRPATPAVLDGVLKTFSELPPHPDVPPAFEQLRNARIRLVTLTNGSAEVTRRLLERAGLDRFVERTISIDEVRHWKPRREVYRHAAKVVNVPARRMALVAAHAWDVLGAGRAGLLTGWVSRRETTFQPAMPPPTVVGASLTEVAAHLLALSG
jgi:2-haloacid dehalogenase